MEVYGQFQARPHCRRDGWGAGGQKLVQIAGARIWYDIYISFALVSFLDCTTQPFQTKPKSFCKWEPFGFIVRFNVKIFSRTALSEGPEKFFPLGSICTLGGPAPPLNPKWKLPYPLTRRLCESESRCGCFGESKSFCLSGIWNTGSSSL